MAVWEEPARGGYPDPSLLALPGLERMRAGAQGHMPPPPMAHLLGTQLYGLEPGTARVTMPATGWLLSPQGRIPVGVLAMPADIVFGCALATVLGPGDGFTTAELSLNRLHTPEVGGQLVACGRLLFFEPPLALTEASITDSAGRLVAHGTSRLTVFPAAEPLPPPPNALPVIEPVTYPTADPWQRPPEGEVLDDAVWQEMTGLEVLTAQVEDRLPLSPISHLTGLRPTDVGEGTATAVLPCTEWLNTPGGNVQGGATAMLADAAMQMAIQTTSGRGDRFLPLDYKVNYLRPVFSDKRDLTARGQVVHRGRQIVIANAEIVNADNKRVALATGSGRYLPATA
jgi:uncharacterized protein (TIGR00369 family)